MISSIATEEGVERVDSTSFSFVAVTGLAEEGVNRTVSSSSGLGAGVAGEGVESTASSFGATESLENTVSKCLGFVAVRVVAPCRARFR